MTLIYQPVPLHQMTKDEAWKQGRSRRWPKWSTVCHLHALGLPVVNTCMVPPGRSGMLAEAITMMAAACKTDRLMLRSDGGIETKKYYRGGKVFPVATLEREASPLLADGRSILLLEPTDRLDNRLNALFRMDRDTFNGDGEISIELLGPGYDIADLTRGSIPPQMTVTISNVSWRHYSRPWWSDISVKIHEFSESERRDRRLDFIRQHILIPTGKLDESSDRSDVVAWLKSHGYERLWQPIDRDRIKAMISRWHEDLFMVAQTYPNRAWNCLATGWSLMGIGRTIYWDVVDSAHKYGVTNGLRGSYEL